MLEELPGDRQCVYFINTRQIYYLKLYSMSLIFSVKFLQYNGEGLWRGPEAGEAL